MLTNCISLPYHVLFIANGQGFNRRFKGIPGSRQFKRHSRFNGSMQFQTIHSSTSDSESHLTTNSIGLHPKPNSMEHHNGQRRTFLPQHLRIINHKRKEFFFVFVLFCFVVLFRFDCFVFFRTMICFQ